MSSQSRKKDKDQDTDPEQRIASSEIFDVPTVEIQALARLDPEDEPVIGPRPVIPAASGSADASGHEPEQEPAPPAPIPLAEIPLYLRNPGPPPRLPRNADFTSYGRTSYRLNSVQRGYNRRPLLWACAVIGVAILYVLLIVKPQNRLLEDPVAIEPTPIVARITGSAAELTPTLGPVPTDEQFGLVTVPEGLVVEEPSLGASPVEKVKQYTVLTFQRKSTAGVGWYQLKGGKGWISALSVKAYPSEQTALAAKQELESKTSSKP